MCGFLCSFAPNEMYLPIEGSIAVQRISLDGFTGLPFWYLRYLEMIDGPSEDEMSLSSFIHRKTKQRDIKSPQQMILKIC